MKEVFYQEFIEYEKFSLKEYQIFIESDGFQNLYDSTLNLFFSKIKENFVGLNQLVILGKPNKVKRYLAYYISEKLNLEIFLLQSEIILKYIGETEKNLSKIKELEKNQCILFFDEADALFGKNKELGKNKDKYANQEVSYLRKALLNYKALKIHCFLNKKEMKTGSLVSKNDIFFIEV